MVVKSSLDAAPNIFFRSESTERDSLQGLTLFGFANEFVTTAIRKAEVANECIEPPGLQKFQCALCTINDSDFVTALESSRERIRRLSA